MGLCSLEGCFLQQKQSCPAWLWQINLIIRAPLHLPASSSNSLPERMALDCSRSSHFRQAARTLSLKSASCRTKLHSLVNGRIAAYELRATARALPLLLCNVFRVGRNVSCVDAAAAHASCTGSPLATGAAIPYNGCLRRTPLSNTPESQLCHHRQLSIMKCATLQVTLHVHTSPTWPDGQPRWPREVYNVRQNSAMAAMSKSTEA